MLEVEVKIPIKQEEFAGKLEELGFVSTKGKYEKDIYFNGNKTDLRREDKALRIRESRDLQTGTTTYELNYKGPKLDNISMTRSEVEFTVPSIEEAELMFNGLGFYEAGSVEKVRSYYNKGDLTCCIDKVTGLGDYLEIEIVTTKDKYDEAISRIQKLLGEMGLSMEDTIRSSYLSMLERGGIYEKSAY